MNEITMSAKLPAKVMEMFKKSFKNYEELMAYYSCAIMEIETKFNVLNKQFSLTQEYNPIETIKSRLKSPESILEKMQRKGYPMSAESIEMNMHDVAGIRVICPFISDIYMRAKELHVAAEVPRGVFVIRLIDEQMESIPLDVVQNLFPDRQNDFVLSVGEADVALIHQMSESAGAKELEKVAAQIEEALRLDGESRVFVGVGTMAMHLRDLAKSYKEAQIAIEVGKVFDTERYIINYENLGIGRLIYQLPTTLCEMFLQEVFKKNPIDALDQETLFTIYKFFENNLNVSETARKLFVHRNTLVYRLEKIKKLTGLDLREFDDAITFKVALMVKKYLTSRGIEA